MYTTTRFQSSTRCTPGRATIVEFAFFPVSRPPSTTHPIPVPALPPRRARPPRVLSREIPSLPFAVHPPIIPNTENTVERYYYSRPFPIVALFHEIFVCVYLCWLRAGKLETRVLELALLPSKILACSLIFRSVLRRDRLFASKFLLFFIKFDRSCNQSKIIENR